MAIRDEGRPKIADSLLLINPLYVLRTYDSGNCMVLVWHVLIGVAGIPVEIVMICGNWEEPIGEFDLGFHYVIGCIGNNNQGMEEKGHQLQFLVQQRLTHTTQITEICGNSMNLFCQLLVFCACEIIQEEKLMSTFSFYC